MLEFTACTSSNLTLVILRSLPISDSHCLLSLTFFQRTPLHIAAEQSDVNTVKTLLDNGSDTTIKDKDGVYAYDCTIGSRLIVLVYVCLAFIPTHPKKLAFLFI